MSSSNRKRPRPGGFFAVGLTVIQATMKDPDESIGEGAKGLMMGLASLTEQAVVVARASGARQRAKGPLVAGISKPPVAGHAGEDDAARAGRLRDGRTARVVLSRFRMGKAGSVVAELRQNPGAEHDAKSGKTAVDLGVRVLLKTGAQFRLQAGQLRIDVPLGLNARFQPVLTNRSLGETVS